jgi:hypothetical protein
MGISRKDKYWYLLFSQPMGCMEDIRIRKKTIFKTHMCGGQPSLIPYLSFKEEGRALTLSPLTLSFSR